MRLGDVLNGYEIVTVPTNAGGGMSQWAFATRDGGNFFVKMFLAPKFPLDDGPGSPEAKARKRDVCLAFERRHLDIAQRLDPSKPGGGNLVVARDFFRVEATYVKVMDKVDAAHLPPANELSARQVLVVLRSLAFSLRMLHEQGVVHGDLKPDNVMVQHTGEGLYVSKLIDFDEAYVVGQPPAPEHIVGDPAYYSPELLRYIKRDERLPTDALSTASDVFSLGLLLHVFLTGDQPAFDRSKVHYPAEALLGRLPLPISAAPPVIQPLLARMLALVPASRPRIDDVIEFLATVDAEALVPTTMAGRSLRPTPSVSPAGGPVPSPAPASAIRSTMGRSSRPGEGSPR